MSNLNEDNENELLISKNNKTLDIINNVNYHNNLKQNIHNNIAALQCYKKNINNSFTCNNFNKYKSIYKEIDYNKNNKYILHNSKITSSFRYFIFILCCLSLAGSYYSYDIPGALHSSLRIHFSQKLKSKDFEYFFTLMYTCYSLPNMVAPVIGGYLIVKYGNRKMYIIFSFLVMIGQMIFAIGISNKSVYISLIGRFIYGLGGESLNTTQSTIIIYWFSMDKISFIFGLFLSFSRLANVMNDIISPRVVTHSNVISSVWIGFLICSVSFYCTILLTYLDWREDIKIGLLNASEKISDISSNNNYKVSFKDGFKFNKMYYLLSLYCMTMYGIFMPFNFISTSFFIHNWFNGEVNEESIRISGEAMSVPFLMCSILVPIFGIFIDKYGKRQIALIISAFLILISFIFFIFSNIIYGIATFGISFSIFASVIWPSIALIVSVDYLGFALGITTALQNISVTIIPFLITYMFEKTGSYTKICLVFIILSFFSIITSILIYILDGQLKNNLNNSTHKIAKN